MKTGVVLEQQLLAQVMSTGTVDDATTDESLVLYDVIGDDVAELASVLAGTPMEDEVAVLAGAFNAPSARVAARPRRRTCTTADASGGRSWGG